MKLKEAIEVLLQFAVRWEQLEKEAARGPVTIEEVAEALWKGEFADDFATPQEFKDYMHRLLRADLFARERRDDVRVIVELEGEQPASANKRLEELEEWLRTNAPEVMPERRRSDETSQDAGTILAVVLGSASAVAFFKGLAVLMGKWGSQISIKTEDGELVARGDAVKQVDPSAFVAEVRRKRAAHKKK